MLRGKQQMVFPILSFHATSQPPVPSKLPSTAQWLYPPSTSIRRETLQELNLPPPSHCPPDSASLAGGSSSLLRPVTMCTLEVPQMKKKPKNRPPQKFEQLAPAITKFITCPSNCKSHLHSLLVIHFPLCSTYGVFQERAGFPLAIVGSDPRGSSSFHQECVGHNPSYHFPSHQEKSYKMGCQASKMLIVTTNLG